jgi:acyl transferase domain-containing protein
VGHLYQEGAIGSKDGRCRSFDALATGTVFSDGVGVVVLKRLEDALADKDTIHAVIRGVAVNNDGATKAGFTAPSVDGQAEAIQLAQDLAGIDPGTIGYIEAHGTATPIGDPIEVAALTQAFRKQTTGRQFCALGSVKSNIGHLDAAAGIAGFIKAVLAIEKGVLPPTAHFSTPNPAIDFASSPFYVLAEARPWRTPCRRAGVSSFGVGGTNAHVVLEQGPPSPPREMPSASRLLVLSARSETALSAMRSRLAECLRKPESAALVDVAHTLAVGRRAFDHRLAFSCSSKEEAVEVLSGARLASAHFGRKGKTDARTAFLFPGQGSQRVAMAQGLYRLRSSFAADVDACARAFEPHMGFDLRSLLLSGGETACTPERHLDDTAVTQPALFATEYCLARLWLSLGVEPVAMVGHSLGEYVAACIAGVFSLEEAALLVASRGQLMQAQPRGSMMAVQLSPEELAPKLGPNVVIAACNAPQSTVAAGPSEAVELLASQLSAQGVRGKVLTTSHAFHSPMMEGMLRPFRAVFAQVSPKAPQRPWISCVTGAPITPAEAIDPDYWVRQIREPVQFSRAIQGLGQQPEIVFIEVGPGHALAALVEQHTERANADKQIVLSSGKEASLDERALTDAACQLWCMGVKVATSSFTSAPEARLVSLPTYPFERKRYWIAAGGADARTTDRANGKAGASTGGPEDALGTGAHGLARGDQEEASLPVETRLCRLLAAVLRVGPSDIDAAKTMLELGFDSLLFVQLGVRLQRAFGVSLTLRDLMEVHSTPKALAQHLEDLPGQRKVAGSPANVAPPTANAATADPRVPPVSGARLGRDAQGNPAWFVPDPNRPGKYMQVK